MRITKKSVLRAISAVTAVCVAASAVCVVLNNKPDTVIDYKITDNFELFEDMSVSFNEGTLTYDEFGHDLPDSPANSWFETEYAAEENYADYEEYAAYTSDPSLLEVDPEYGMLRSYNGTEDTVVIPEYITEISGHSFDGNETVTRIILPATVRVLLLDAFTGCTNLSEVVFLGTVEEWENVDVSATAIPESVSVIYAPYREAQEEAPAEEPVSEDEIPVEEPVIESETPVEEPVIESETPVEEPVIESEAPVEEPVSESEVPVEEPVIESEAPVEEPVIESEAPVEEPVIESETPVEGSVIEGEIPVEEPVIESEIPVEEPVSESEIPIEEPGSEDETPAETSGTEDETTLEAPTADYEETQTNEAADTTTPAESDETPAEDTDTTSETDTSETSETGTDETAESTAPETESSDETTAVSEADGEETSESEETSVTDESDSSAETEETSAPDELSGNTDEDTTVPPVPEDLNEYGEEQFPDEAETTDELPAYDETEDTAEPDENYEPDGTDDTDVPEEELPEENVEEEEDTPKPKTVSLVSQLDGLDGGRTKIAARMSYFPSSAVVMVANSAEAESYAAEAGFDGNYYAFDISIVNADTNEAIHSLLGNITFSIGIPSILSADDNLYVYHINSSGYPEQLPCGTLWSSDGDLMIEFSSSEFSPFVFTNHELTVSYINESGLLDEENRQPSEETTGADGISYGDNDGNGYTADTEGGQSSSGVDGAADTYDYDEDEPTIRVTFPSSTTFILNPYKLDVKIGDNELSDAPVISPQMSIMSESDCKIDVYMTATAYNIPDTVRYSNTYLTNGETEKSIFIYAEAGKRDRESGLYMYNGYYTGAEDQIAVTNDGSISGKLLELDAAEEGSSTEGRFKLFGQTFMPKDDAWNEDETVDILMVFRIEAAGRPVRTAKTAAEGPAEEYSFSPAEEYAFSPAEEYVPEAERFVSEPAADEANGTDEETLSEPAEYGEPMNEPETTPSELPGMFADTESDPVETSESVEPEAVPSEPEADTAGNSAEDTPAAAETVQEPVENAPETQVPNIEE